MLENGPLYLQVFLSPDLWQKERDVLREARVLIVAGQLEKRGRAWTIRADRIVDAQSNDPSKMEVA